MKKMFGLEKVKSPFRPSKGKTPKLKTLKTESPKVKPIKKIASTKRKK